MPNLQSIYLHSLVVNLLVTSIAPGITYAINAIESTQSANLQELGIVFSSQDDYVEFYLHPTLDFQIISEIINGTTVKVVSTIDNWYQVELADQIGWVRGICFTE